MIRLFNMAFCGVTAGLALDWVRHPSVQRLVAYVILAFVVGYALTVILAWIYDRKEWKWATKK